MKKLHLVCCLSIMAMISGVCPGIAPLEAFATEAPAPAPVAGQETSASDDKIYKAAEEAMLKKDYAEARQHLEIIVNKYPFSQYYNQAIFQMGLAMFRTGAREEGAKMLEKGLILQPVSGFSRDTVLLLADYYYDNNRMEQAGKHYDFLGRNYSGPTLGDYVTFRSGKLKSSLGDPKGAVEDMERFVREYPQSPLMNEALTILLELYNRMGRSSQAATLYEAKHKRFAGMADDGRGLLAVSTAYATLGFHENTLEVLSEFERAFPKSAVMADALARKGQSLLALKRHQEAEKALKAALSLNKQLPEATLALATCYMERERLGDAALLLRAFPNTSDNLLTLRAALLEGNLLVKLKKNNEAMKVYARAVEAAGRLDPADALVKETLPKAYLGIGDILFAVRKYTDAINAYGKSRDLGAAMEDLYWVLYRIGNCWEKLGDNTKAVESYQALASSSADPFWVGRANSRVDDIGFNSKLNEPRGKGAQ